MALARRETGRPPGDLPAQSALCQSAHTLGPLGFAAQAAETEGAARPRRKIFVRGRGWSCISGANMVKY